MVQITSNVQHSAWLILIPLLLTAGLAAFLVGYGGDSMFTSSPWVIDHDYIESAIEYHKSGHPAFERRIITTTIITTLHEVLNIPESTAFISTSLFFLFLSGVVLLALTFHYTHHLHDIVLSQVLFYSSFPILFLFFQPIYGYDEPIQIALIFLTLLLILKGSWHIVMLLTFLLASITRETSLLLIPGILYFLNNSQNRKQKHAARITIAMSIITFVVIVLLIVSYVSTWEETIQGLWKRTEILSLNFGDKVRFTESAISIFLVTALPTFFMFKIKGDSRFPKGWKAFSSTLIFNTLTVCLLAKARESRLFLLPLFFWYPISGMLFREEILKISSFLKSQRIKLILLRTIVFSCWTVASLFLAFIIYPKTPAGIGDNPFPLYLFSIIELLGVFILFVPPGNKKAPKFEA